MNFFMEEDLFGHYMESFKPFVYRVSEKELYTV